MRVQKIQILLDPKRIKSRWENLCEKDNLNESALICWNNEHNALFRIKRDVLLKWSVDTNSWIKHHTFDTKSTSFKSKFNHFISAIVASSTNAIYAFNNFGSMAI